jgi:hypothetical protein
MGVLQNFGSTIPTESFNVDNKKLRIQSFFPQYWKPLITLLLITPILTELLTNNISVFHFFKPKLFFILIVLVYGPALLLRELAVRWNLSLAGYILLGLVYGIYNEGLVAKTFFQSNIANTAFDNYGMVWHINLTWAAVIIVFHAFYAFLFPLLIVYNIFPKLAFTPWINKKWWLGISAVAFLYISYAFLKNTWPASPLHYVVLIAVMAGLIIIAKYFKAASITDGKKKRFWLPICYGIIFVASTFALADIIARSRVHFLLFIAYAIINLLTFVILLNKKYSIWLLLMFGLSAQAGFAISAALVAALLKSKIGIITGCTFALAFTSTLIVLIFRRRDNNLVNQIRL